MCLSKDYLKACSICAIDYIDITLEEDFHFSFK